MKRTLIFILLLLALPHVHAAVALREVVLGTNVFSSGSAPDTVNGGSLEHIECIFRDLKQPYHVNTMPWLRARQEVRKGTIDGFFTAVSLDDAEDYAVFSDPLVLEGWYWFWRKDTAAPESWKTGYTLGAILGSQQATWLNNAGYAKPRTANDLPQLVKMLFGKRIDVILADKEKFEEASQALGISESAYQYRFYRYVPLGVYFGKQFVTDHPALIQQFNRHIYSCAPDGFQLSEYERDKIKRFALPMLQEWSQRPDLLTALEQQNRQFSALPQDVIFERDEKWQEEFRQGNFDFAGTVLSKPLSQTLRQIRTANASLISEIIVMDERGINVAVSDMTSDYWQGDEAKYLLSYHKFSDNLVFEPVSYDESSMRFQVNVSKPVYSESGEVFLGVITVGIIVEKALSLPE